jgi:Flp pilus assembly pilin Flp
MAARKIFPHYSRGQSVVEYGLLLGTVALVVLMGVSAFGKLIQPWFEGLARRVVTIGT